MFEKNFYCVSSRIENSGQLYGCFKIGPFSRHQSLTFANALRRTLLADKSKCTFNAVQINNVEHEFSSLIGVRESVVDILLNLEKLIFQIKKPITKPQVAFINFCGPGIVRAQHIYLPSNFKCVIPSQYIATLEVDGKLTLKLFFSPDWNKFQFFLQNLILEKKGTKPSARESSERTLDIKGSTWLGRAQRASGLPIKINKQKYLKKVEKQCSILHKKISPSLNLNTPHAFSINQILNNRLKIVHYLTKTRNRFLQLLSIKFQFFHLKIPTSVKKLPWLTELQKDKIQSNYKKWVPHWRIQYQKQRIKTNYKKNKIRLNFLKNPAQRGSSAISDPVPKSPFGGRSAPVGNIFAQKIQENFLFLNSSRCAIEKANYTLQSNILEGEGPISPKTSTPRRPLGSPHPEKVSDTGDKGTQTKNDIRRAARLGDGPQIGLSAAHSASFAPSLRKAKNNSTFVIRQARAQYNSIFQQNNLNKSKKFAKKKSNMHFLALAQNRSFPLKCHLKLNSHSRVQRKLRFLAHPRGYDRNRISSSSGWSWLGPRNIIYKNEEYILFEVWTDGSLLPQTAILRAINELLFEMFPYSLQISKYEKINQISNNKIFSFINRKNSLKFIQNSFKRQRFFSDLSKKSFRENFLNLEIGNFYFDLETYLFLKKRKIHRIIDFLKFLNQKETTKLINTQNLKQNIKPGLKMTLYKFQIFLNTLIG